MTTYLATVRSSIMKPVLLNRAGQIDADGRSKPMTALPKVWTRSRLCLRVSSFWLGLIVSIPVESMVSAVGSVGALFSNTLMKLSIELRSDT